MKNNHYNFLAQLQSNLHKLYETFEYKPESIMLTPPHDIIQHIEAFVDNGRMVNYLDSVIDQIKNATKTAENLRLDNWSMKEDVEEYKKRISKLEERTHECDKKDNDSALNMCLIRGFISLYDNQIIRRDFIRQQPSSDDSALRVAESVIKEIENLLKNSGIEIIDDKGEFSGKTQMIVDVKEADFPELAGTVCDTVRVGFRYRDETLRAQEVIVYTQKENG